MERDLELIADTEDSEPINLRTLDIRLKKIEPEEFLAMRENRDYANTMKAKMKEGRKDIRLEGWSTYRYDNPFSFDSWMKVKEFLYEAVSRHLLQDVHIPLIGSHEQNEADWKYEEGRMMRVETIMKNFARYRFMEIKLKPHSKHGKYKRRKVDGAFISHNIGPLGVLELQIRHSNVGLWENLTYDVPPDRQPRKTHLWAIAELDGNSLVHPPTPEETAAYGNS